MTLRDTSYKTLHDVLWCYTALSDAGNPGNVTVSWWYAALATRRCVTFRDAAWRYVIVQIFYMKYQKCTWILALHYRWTFLSIRCKFKSRHKKFQRTWCVDLLNRQYANSVTKRSHRFLWRFTITTCDGYSQIWCNSGTFLTAISAYCCGSKNYHIHIQYIERLAISPIQNK